MNLFTSGFCLLHEGAEQGLLNAPCVYECCHVMSTRTGIRFGSEPSGTKGIDLEIRERRRNYTRNAMTHAGDRLVQDYMAIMRRVAGKLHLQAAIFTSWNGAASTPAPFLVSCACRLASRQLLRLSAYASKILRISVEQIPAKLLSVAYVR